MPAKRTTVAPRKPSPAALKKKKARAKRQYYAACRVRAAEMYVSGWSQARISEELKIPEGTLSSWFKKDGIRKPAAIAPEVLEEAQREQRELDYEEVAPTMFAERDAEVDRMLAVAQNQASPADQYQAFIASAGIRMMRDSMQLVRGPRTVRELAELDALIRRNLGLNPKGGGAGGLTIDISILNDTKPVRHGVVVEAEPADDE